MIEVRDEETIIAQCTPSGSGAIALLRLSGNNAIEIAQKCAQLSGKKNLTKLPTHTIHYGWVIDDHATKIDQVLFFLMHAPQTFTGQNTVEITCHNNPFIIEAIIEQAIKHGARIAEPGEFTKRAFLNKKIDLAQAEALNELIHAHTQSALKKSLAQLEGSFSHWLNTLETQLLHALSLCEASFEFIEEELNFDDQIRTIINNVISKIDDIEQHYSQQQHIKEGLRIALIGSVNAGKSSLFNKLIKKERAIVTEIAGTTRDVIEAGIYQDQAYITFVDTAGLRQTNEKIELEGIKRSFQEAEKADIILLVFDPCNPLMPSEEKIYQQLFDQNTHKIIPICTKCDIAVLKKWKNHILIPLSNKTEDGIRHLEETINKQIKTLLKTASPYLLTKRQYQLLLTLKKDLETIKPMTIAIEYELLAIHLKDALEKITELTGKSINERSMDDIFKQFCIGK